MTKVFVTGVNGLLGTNVTIDLLNKGYHVIGLLRKHAEYKGGTHKNLQLVRGRLFDDFTNILKNVDIVIHIAAITQQNLIKYSDYQPVNYNASVQLLHTAIQSKVKTFVFVSSANTIGYGSFSKPGIESNPIKAPFNASYYARSKQETERELLKHQNKIDIHIINPTFMLGAYDSKPSSGKIIYMCWKKKIVFYPPGGKNFVHVKDVSAGIIKCLEFGRNGERYLIANENLTYKQFFEQINTLTKQKPKMIKIPLCILILIGYIGDVFRFMQLKTNLCSSNMNALYIKNYYSNSKSIAELGLSYRSTQHAINDAVEYFNTLKS